VSVINERGVYQKIRALFFEMWPISDEEKGISYLAKRMSATHTKTIESGGWRERLRLRDLALRFLPSNPGVAMPVIRKMNGERRPCKR